MARTNDTTSCEAFLDKLDAWLADEYAAEYMLAHHDNCARCRQETRLAREILAITSALPELQGPEIHLHSAHAAYVGPTLIERLLATWRQPLVLVPALAILLAAVFVIQLREPQTRVIDPDLVIIDGTAYTREEIQKAAADLELALRYLDKYGTYPAQVISAELESSRLPLPEPQAQSAPIPTI
jgi:hypothetical protein